MVQIQENSVRKRTIIVLGTWKKATPVPLKIKDSNQSKIGFSDA